MAQFAFLAVAFFIFCFAFSHVAVLDDGGRNLLASVIEDHRRVAREQIHHSTEYYSPITASFFITSFSLYIILGFRSTNQCILQYMSQGSGYFWTTYYLVLYRICEFAVGKIAGGVNGMQLGCSLDQVLVCFCNAQLEQLQDLSQGP